MRHKPKKGKEDPTADLPDLLTLGRRQTLAAAALIILAGLAAYSSSFTGVFMLDDLLMIDSPAIQTLWPPWQCLFSPENVTRPLVGLSLALNYHFGGAGVLGYHAFNVAVHLLAALALFGIVRHTLRRPALRAQFAAHATSLALAVALLWAVHPLLTQSVTYIVQRAESMMGLCYLVTLYCFIRGTEQRQESKEVGTPTAGRPGASGALPFSPSPLLPFCPSPRLWYGAAALACFLGAGCKQVIVTAPLIVLLYDRAFVAGSFKAALRRRWRLYAALTLSWGLLAATSLAVPHFQAAGLSLPWSKSTYALSECGVILHYLRLAFWPAGLCLDYLWPMAKSVWAVLPGLAVVGTLALLTVAGLFRARPWAFLGAWFFIVLAPTSSLLPIVDLAEEHRMYLPLAAVVALVVLGAYRAGVYLSRRWSTPASDPSGDAQAKRALPPYAGAWTLGAVLVLAAAVALGLGTYRRNQVYHSQERMWRDVLATHAGNGRAHFNLGKILADLAEAPPAGRKPDALQAEAIWHYREAIRLIPHYAEPFHNWGRELVKLGRYEEAIPKLLASLGLLPDNQKCYANLEAAFLALGKTREEAALYRTALLSNTAKQHHLDLKLLIEAQNYLAVSQLQAGRLDEARGLFNLILQEQPDCAEAAAGLEETREREKSRE